MDLEDFKKCLNNDFDIWLSNSYIKFTRSIPLDQHMSNCVLKDIYDVWNSNNKMIYFWMVVGKNGKKPRISNASYLPNKMLSTPEIIHVSLEKIRDYKIEKVLY